MPFTFEGVLFGWLTQKRAQQAQDEAPVGVKLTMYMLGCVGD